MEITPLPGLAQPAATIHCGAGVVTRRVGGIAQPAAEKLAMASPKVKTALDGRESARTIFVPDRLVNFVI